MSADAANERRGEEREIADLVEPHGRPPKLLQFSLETLLLVTTIIAASLGLAVAVPSMGGPVAVLVVLALIRTLAECRQFQCNGRSVSLVDKLHSFGRSLCYSYLTLVGTLLTAFFLTAVAMLIGGVVYEVALEIGGGTVIAFVMPFVIVSLAVGVIAGSGVVFFLIYWRQWLRD
jgi:hypothetical protein